MVIKMNKLINKIKGLLKGKNKDLPQVNLVNDYQLKQRLTNSFIIDDSVDECLASILSELGVKSDEKVIIKNFQEFSKEEKGKGYYIDCYKNNKYLFKLGFNFEDFFSETPKLIVIYPYIDIKEEYEIYNRSSKKETKITLEEISYEQNYLDKMKYYREYSPDSTKYIISKGENELVLSIEKPYNQNIQKDEKGRDIKYELDNEVELVNYLVELKFPITIEDVYKKICEISLGDNISNYPYIYLYVTNKKNCY